MEGFGSGIEATALLCDAAESVGGKLYILGAGWSQIPAHDPTNMALAVKLSIPSDRPSTPVDVRAFLLTEGDNDFVYQNGMAVALGGEIELGRPFDIDPRTPLDLPFVLNFPGLVLSPGYYVWQLEVDREVKSRIPMRVF